jgi:hypothetical protein
MSKRPMWVLAADRLTCSVAAISVLDKPRPEQNREKGASHGRDKIPAVEARFGGFPVCAGRRRLAQVGDAGYQ